MKKYISVFMAAWMTLTAAACSGNPSSVQMSATEQTIYPLILQDMAGREVTIEKEPEKIVSCYYIGSSLLMSLDLTDRIAAIEGGADKRAIYSLSAPEMIDLPSVGSAKDFDLEGCAALEPDLVVLPEKLRNAAETLDELGIDAVLINPESQQQLLEAVQLIAKAANVEEKAEELVSYIGKQSRYLEEKLKDTDPVSVYFGGNSGLLSTAGSAMYQSDLITRAGGRNVAAGIGDTYWTEVSYEQILDWNPSYIILAADAKYSVEEVLNDEALAECEAVKNGNVYKIPNDAESWDSPLPSGILGAVWLANTLHPDCITVEDCRRIIDEFYETFYGFTYSSK